MAKCIKCKKRKAKRYCTAKGESLCNLCCGLLREKEIHCPPSCSFLRKHKLYQEKRILDKKQTSLPSRSSPEEDILHDERMAWLAYHAEMPLIKYGEAQETFSDKDALLALEYARDKIEREVSRVFLPEERIKPFNEIGEAILQNVERCRYEKKIIISGETQTYKKAEKIKCLERVILTVKHFAQGKYEERRYIEYLIQRFAKIREFSQQNKILAPK